MNKIKIGITGENGFIGSHLAGWVRTSEDFELVPFSRDYFEEPDRLRTFVRYCDAVIHLAAVSRAENGETLYRTNMRLTEQLAQAVRAAGNQPGICFGSTVQIDKPFPYHASKRDGAALLERTAGTWVTDMLMPNVFGPGSRPFYNSVISTFCFLAARGQVPEQITDVLLQVSYVDDLCIHILRLVKQGIRGKNSNRKIIPYQYEVSLPEIWAKLQQWSHLSPAEIPELPSRFDLELWHTLQSYRPVD